MTESPIERDEEEAETLRQLIELHRQHGIELTHLGGSTFALPAASKEGGDDDN